MKRAAAGSRRLAALLPAALPGLLLIGCASPVSVRELATGQIDTPAYELRGEDLPSLQDQAGRLCRHGGQVLHLGYRGDGLRAPGDSWWGQRWSEAQRLAAPVQAQAQMTVVCHPDAARGQVPLRATAPTPAAASIDAAAAAVPDGDMLAADTVAAGAPPVSAASAPEAPAAKHAAGAATPAASAAGAQTAPKSVPMAASAPRLAQAKRQTPYPVLSY
ncbi:MAG: hypothetical protein KBC73_05445 [Burkholderiaceae bacterium]|nr:hypothetical protein [Burkholderiaceae bacterium]